ncbi:hypothetical protein V2G26_002002 [Clonostachys chloroleuca]
MGTRRAREGETRTRTGCNECRQRRVKCPEQKPACKPCRMLGRRCSYNQVLRWQRVQSCSKVATLDTRSTEDWMFLHAYSVDLSARPLPQLLPEAALDDPPDDDAANIKALEWPNTDDDDVFDMPYEEIQPRAWLDPLAMSKMEVYLWTYFHGAIAPTCVLNPSVNPYQAILLRIAASTGKSSPLFNIIMAISARERSILGSREYDSVAIGYHHEALRLLRKETCKMEEGTMDQSSQAQILATVMSLIFLDIMSDCSSSWVIHSDFARSLVQNFRNTRVSLDSDIDALFNFVGGYIVIHEVYAHTAWNAKPSIGSGSPVTVMCDDVNLQTLTGCSTDLFQILADVNSLAADFSALSKLDYGDPELLSGLEERRLYLERRLHQQTPVNESAIHDEDTPESVLAIEIKRLTGQLHLYSRVDNLGPYDPCITRLSSKILSLVKRLSTRSNLILWPLFMVATLGIGVECDAERALILEKLHLLQQKRQMRYIKKARDIIVEVWKRRDFGGSETHLGWTILEQVAQSERISLF